VNCTFLIDNYKKDLRFTIEILPLSSFALGLTPFAVKIAAARKGWFASMADKFSMTPAAVTARATMLAFALAAAPAFAGPNVIPGVGPHEMGAPSQDFVRPAAGSAHGQYGGGFIEMLVTGVEPSPRALYGPTPARAPQIAAYDPAEAPNVRPEIDPMYRRTEVDYSGREKPGSLVVDTANKFLFFIKGDGRAIRYGVGVGRPGFTWSGVKTVSRKAEWPSWTPPKEMLARRPDLPTHMNGGSDNPLGARALYLGSSLYRIHGTNEPFTIGQNVSSGCIRMMNEDVTDLYDRVRVGARVTVR
jgi:lipoprotein-anchoring transpeptidase ErfK/SrfK